MTNEKILELVNDIKVPLNCGMIPEAQKNIEYLVSKLTDAIRAESAKKSGRKEAYAAAKKILSYWDTEAYGKAGAIKAEDGKQIIMNPYLVCKIDEAIECEEGSEDFCGKFLCIADKNMSIARGNEGETILAPSIADIKTFIKLKKAEKIKRIVYDFGEEFPAVDAELLLLVLQIMGEDASITFSETLTHVLYFKSNAGEALLLPVRK